MFLERQLISDLQRYVESANDNVRHGGGGSDGAGWTRLTRAAQDLFKWWAQYLESAGRLGEVCPCVYALR
jgi:hypothetical protein